MNINACCSFFLYAARQRIICTSSCSSTFCIIRIPCVRYFTPVVIQFCYCHCMFLRYLCPCVINSCFVYCCTGRFTSSISGTCIFINCYSSSFRITAACHIAFLGSCECCFSIFTNYRSTIGGICIMVTGRFNRFCFGLVCKHLFCKVSRISFHTICCTSSWSCDFLCYIYSLVFCMGCITFTYRIRSTSSVVIRPCICHSPIMVKSIYCDISRLRFKCFIAICRSKCRCITPNTSFCTSSRSWLCIVAIYGFSNSATVHSIVFTYYSRSTSFVAIRPCICWSIAPIMF